MLSSEQGNLQSYHPKETYSLQKRPTHYKRDLYITEEAYALQKIPIHYKRDPCIITKETFHLIIPRLRQLCNVPDVCVCVCVCVYVCLWADGEAGL